MQQQKQQPRQRTKERFVSEAINLVKLWRICSFHHKVDKFIKLEPKSWMAELFDHIRLGCRISRLSTKNIRRLLLSIKEG
ncbi:unnamed protein product [Paramecium octaurelia]|uniref:Uncharacterized protein n=1 Tax=Paramecium octaurelia TaxID=43137 RepID=A0A8S1V0A2_PAROT|nr:unnamed protein product [Paramecium octaurelia]